MKGEKKKIRHHRSHRILYTVIKIVQCCKNKWIAKTKKIDGFSRPLGTIVKDIKRQKNENKTEKTNCI